MATLPINYDYDKLLYLILEGMYIILKNIQIPNKGSIYSKKNS